MDSNSVISTGLILTGVLSALTSLAVFHLIRKVGPAFRFVISLAVLDVIYGLSTTVSGIQNFLMAAYFTHDQPITARDCLYLYPHIATWTILDVMQCILLFMYAFDRFGNLLFPISYTTITRRFYIVVASLLLTTVIASMFVGFSVIALTYSNEGELNGTICHIEDMMGWENYQKLDSMTKTIAILGLVFASIAMMAGAVRYSDKTWSYFLRNESDYPLTLGYICLFRSAVFCSGLFIAEFLEPEESEADQYSRSLVLRICSVLTTSVFLPIVLLLFLSKLRKGIAKSFSKYTVNPEIVDTGAAGAKDMEGNRDVFSMSVWSTTEHIGQIDMEPPEERARREKSVSFYRDVRDVRYGDDEILHKMRDARQLAEMSKQNSRQQLLMT